MDIKGFIRDYEKAIALTTRSTPVEAFESFLDDIQFYRNRIEETEELLKESFGSKRLEVLENFFDTLKNHDGTYKFSKLMDQVEINHIFLKFDSND
jgi:RNA binding exosome subunit